MVTARTRPRARLAFSALNYALLLTKALEPKTEGLPVLLDGRASHWHAGGPEHAPSTLNEMKFGIARTPNQRHTSTCTLRDVEQGIGSRPGHQRREQSQLLAQDPEVPQSPKEVAICGWEPGSEVRQHREHLTRA